MSKRALTPWLLIIAIAASGCSTFHRPAVGKMQVRPISESDLARLQAIVAESEAAAAEMRARLLAAGQD